MAPRRAAAENDVDEEEKRGDQSDDEDADVERGVVRVGDLRRKQSFTSWRLSFCEQGDDIGEKNISPISLAQGNDDVYFRDQYAYGNYNNDVFTCIVACESVYCCGWHTKKSEDKERWTCDGGRPHLFFEIGPLGCSLGCSCTPVPRRPSDR